MTLFLGLCDSQRLPFHPEAVSRVNVDSIKWKWQRSKKRWQIELVNENDVDFRVKQSIRNPAGTTYMAFFELYYDIEPCTPPLPLRQEITFADPDDCIRCWPGALIVEHDFSKHRVRA